MNSTSEASATSAYAEQSNSKLSQRTKGGATGVYLKSSPELCYGLGTSSTQMATAQIRCSSGDVYNESISYVPRLSVCPRSSESSALLLARSDLRLFDCARMLHSRLFL